MSLNGLSVVSVELTSRCNKNCWICGRRERDKLGLPNNYGDMPIELVALIASQVPEGIVIQLHNNGEPLLYPYLKEAIDCFKKRNCITNFVTNGKLLVDKAYDIIDRLDSMSISIIENDPEWKEQLEVIEQFLKIKGDRKPFTSLRFVGTIDETRYEHINILKIHRVLHAPKGSVEYKKRVTIPEIGICIEFLNHLAIDRYGHVSTCVRFDPTGDLRLGNIKYEKLVKLWNSQKRLKMRHLHISGRRNEIPYCGDKCSYWGCPRGD